MTIREIKESISAFQDKNSFDYERKDCEEVNRLFFPSPESFEIIRSEHKDYNTTGKSDRFGTQEKTNKNVIRTWATTQEKSIQRISRPK